MNILKFILLALPILIVAGFIFFAAIDVPVKQKAVRVDIPAVKVFNE